MPRPKVFRQMQGEVDQSLSLRLGHGLHFVLIVHLYSSLGLTTFPREDSETTLISTMAPSRGPQSSAS
jgi:hypothetical protein